jgi:hypothetical protein
MGDINQLVRLLHLPPDLLRGGENLSKASSATRSTEQPKAAAAEEAAAKNILTYEKTAKTQKDESYPVSHLYYSLDGKKHAGAKKFLDGLIEWNSLSDNERLSKDECNGCSSTQKGVNSRNETVDTPVDLNNVKRMSNVSVTYADSANDKDNGKFNVRIWSPGSGSGSETYASVVDYCDIQNEAPERKVMVSLLKKMYERYVELKQHMVTNKNGQSQEWKGWYYLSRFALEKKGSVKLYEIVDKDNRIAYVPIMQHAPELTFLHKNKNGTTMNITNFKDFEKYTDIKKIEYVKKTEEERKTLQKESFMVDVKLADGVADGAKPQKKQIFNCISDAANVAEIYGCKPKK